MKKEVYKHYGTVVDKEYNKRKKVVKPNMPITLLLCVPFLLLALWRLGNGGHFLFMFVVMYVTFIANMFIVKAIQECILNKRAYLTDVIILGCFASILLALWLFYLGALDGLSNAGKMFVLVGSVFGGVGIIIVYALIRFLITRGKERDACTLSVTAQCVGYEGKTIRRYVDNSARAKRERRLSPAYGDDEYVTVYTPIFRFTLDGVEYNSKPNFETNAKKFEEGVCYDIFVNPNDPTEIRV